MGLKCKRAGNSFCRFAGFTGFALSLFSEVLFPRECGGYNNNQQHPMGKGNPLVEIEIQYQECGLVRLRFNINREDQEKRACGFPEVWYAIGKSGKDRV